MSRFGRKLFGKKASKADISADNIDINALQSNMEISSFLLACEQGDLSTLCSILTKYDEANSNLELLLNYKDPNTNKTGLIYACIAGHGEIVCELIKYGVNIEQCHDGTTPLYHATSRGHIQIVQTLLTEKAKVDAINNKGWTCLMNAAYFGRDDIVKLLLEYNANPDIARNAFDGKCALHFACKNGRYDVVQLLLNYGANPNMSDKDEATTPLMYAVLHGYQQIIELLLIYGADPMITNANDKKAIDFIQYEPDLTDEHKQKNLYLLMNESGAIHECIHKLVNPQKMRIILHSMNKLKNNYPFISEKINNCRHISQLYEINNIDMHAFNELCGSRIKQNMSALRIYDDGHAADDGDGDADDVYDILLNGFGEKVLVTQEKCDIASDNILCNENEIKEIKQEIINKRKNINELMAQISMLKRQLTQCDNAKIYLNQKLIKQEKKRSYLTQEMFDVNEKLKVDNVMFELMAKVNTNIKSLCEKAGKLPNKYECKLQTIYEKKRKDLEQNWRYWELNDIITWICKLDLNGKFEKYYQDLHKLRELEHIDDDYEQISMSDEENEDNQSLEMEGNLNFSLKDLQKMDSEIDKILPVLISPNLNEAKEEEEILQLHENHTPILALINDTVLKMCGIKNNVDRKVIMMNIESLINRSSEIDAYEINENEADLFAFEEGDIEELTNHVINEEEEEEDDENMNDLQVEELLNCMEDNELKHNEIEVKENINNKFLCPISNCIMTDPVICSDGFSYERRAIQQWLLSNDISPVTKHKLSTKQLFTNQNLKAMIQDFQVTQK